MGARSVCGRDGLDESLGLGYISVMLSLSNDYVAFVEVIFMKIVSIQGVRSSFSTRTGDHETFKCSKRIKRIIEMGCKFAHDLFGGIRSM